ncbi:MAG: substrate-binding domain-containing protein, partial [Lachnospiraceae bacterium]|nr:substrate-binding domain-containing protein [Lachnospiraceae bacterium]
MRKRLISIFAALILFISALSACTRGESSVTPEETTEALDPTTPKPTETDPPETSPSETEPSESTPQETEPIDPDTLMFTPENYPKVDGSTATKPLAKAFQEALTGEKDVEINHSKTGKAYTKLVDGEVDLILVVEPSEDNKAYADEKKVTLKLSKVANEGFVFFVNKRNPVNSLTADQIRKIYSGEITNWKEVGGLDAEIVAFQRPVNSGSQTGMESIVMGDTPLTEPVTERIAGSMEDIIDVISAFDGGENAIGYSYYYYANTMYLGENIKMIGVDGIMPNNTTICDMEYPFLTAYYAVTREGDESDRTKDLLNYMLSEYGQKDVLKAGYVPIFDVGSAPSDGKEASDERTIHLSDTYDRAAIQVTEVTEERNGSQFMCLEIDGLRDITVQEKVNQALRENSENAFAEAMKKTDGMSDKAKVYLNARLIGAFSDILSVEVSVTTDDGAGNWYNDYAPVNLKLSDGEVIRFHDL